MLPPFLLTRSVYVYWTNLFVGIFAEKIWLPSQIIPISKNASQTKWAEAKIIVQIHTIVQFNWGNISEFDWNISIDIIVVIRLILFTSWIEWIYQCFVTLFIWHTIHPKLKIKFLLLKSIDREKFAYSFQWWQIENSYTGSFIILKIPIVHRQR